MQTPAGLVCENNPGVGTIQTVSDAQSAASQPSSGPQGLCGLFGPSVGYLGSVVAEVAGRDQSVHGEATTDMLEAVEDDPLLVAMVPEVVVVKDVSAVVVDEVVLEGDPPWFPPSSVEGGPNAEIL